MKTIVVATDFSERSDRAIRRAKLLAREFDSKLHLVHVVDDDLAQAIVLAERDASTKILEEMTNTIEGNDGLECDFRVVLGKPFFGINQVARDLKADLIVVGPHRRQLLRGILVGTTVERTIRTSDRPILLANGVPAASYSRSLIASDLSAFSEETIRTANTMGLLGRLNVSLLHVFSGPGMALMNRASLSEDEKRYYIAGERTRAAKEVASFMDKLDVDGMSTILKPATSSIVGTICDTATELSAELIVIGTSARSAILRVLLGSVTEGVLSTTDRDVLAIPPQQIQADEANRADGAVT